MWERKKSERERETKKIITEMLETETISYVWLLVFVLLMKMVVAIKTCSCHWIIGQYWKARRKQQRLNQNGAMLNHWLFRSSGGFNEKKLVALNGTIELYVNILKLNRYDVICCNPMLMTASSTHTKKNVNGTRQSLAKRNGDRMRANELQTCQQ